MPGEAQHHRGLSRASKSRGRQLGALGERDQDQSLAEVPVPEPAQSGQGSGDEEQFVHCSLLLATAARGMGGPGVIHSRGPSRARTSTPKTVKEAASTRTTAQSTPTTAGTFVRTMTAATRPISHA